MTAINDAFNAVLSGSVADYGELIYALNQLNRAGTWTPVILDTSNSTAEGQTYTTNAGVFIRSGAIVLCFANVVMSSLGSLNTSQQTRIGGLPYNVSSSGRWLLAGQTTETSTLNLPEAGPLTFTGEAGTRRCFVWRQNAGTTGVGQFTLSHLSADGRILFWLIYRTEDALD